MSNEIQEYNANISAVQIFNDAGLFDRATQLARVMATSKSMVPAHLRTEGDCLGIILDSWSWKLNPFAVARKTHIVNGNLGYEAQVLAAAINNSPDIEGSFHFEWFGDWSKVIGKFDIKKNEKGQEYRVPGWKLAEEEGIGIRVSATKKGENEPRVLELLLAQARVRNSTMWADDPKQQLAYLVQKKWARLYAPGIIMGAYSDDEIMDMEPKDITPQKQGGVYAKPKNEPDNGLVEKEVDRLKAVAKQSGIEAYKKAWTALSADMRKSIGAKRHEEMKSLAEGSNVIDGDFSEVDKETGVIDEGKDPQAEVKTYTYAETNDALIKSKTSAELSVAAKMINGVEGQMLQQELDEIYKNRQAELQG